MIHTITNNLNSKKSSLLLVYNLYRFISIGVLCGASLLDSKVQTHPFGFSSLLIIYCLFGVFFLILGLKYVVYYKQQVFVAGMIDLLFLVCLVDTMEVSLMELGILVNVTIAALSILTPGRLAIFFAALASCLFLGISVYDYLHDLNGDLNHFFSTGIYGTSFFATALTSWGVARLIEPKEQLAAQQALELANMQQLNEYIVERLYYGVIFVTDALEIKLINSAARQYFNVSDQQKTLGLRELSDELYHCCNHFISRPIHANSSAQTIINDGALRIHLHSARYGGQLAILVIIEDTVSLAQQAQQLKLASLGQFSASIAHELRNPLGIIAHAAQLMGGDMNLCSEDTRLKELIVNNCERMNRVIKNVLQLSRRQKAKPEVIELASYLEQFKQHFSQFTTCNMKLYIPIEQTIMFDRSHLEQILIILCENALQHGCDCNGDTHITITADKKAGILNLIVYDQGPGIPISIRPSIFDPFFTTTKEGHGMGLFIAKDLCEINQAQLSLVDSIQGCCFSISLGQYELL
ncbi:MAG: sensor histidine kinase [Legionella sp.]